MKSNSDSKTEELFEQFLEGLVASVSNYIYKPTKFIDVLSFSSKKYTLNCDYRIGQVGMQEVQNEYMPNIDEIVKRQYEAVKRYCNIYFMDLIIKNNGTPNELLEHITPRINDLLTLLDRLINWDTNAFHVENTIQEKNLLHTWMNNAEIFEIYKQVADDLTKSILKEDRKHIYELWECVINVIGV